MFVSDAGMLETNGVIPPVIIWIGRTGVTGAVCVDLWMNE